MGALWLGVGKGLKRGGVLENVENVNVYSLLCHLLGITPAKNSGRLEVWRDVLATPQSTPSAAADVLTAVSASDVDTASRL